MEIPENYRLKALVDVNRPGQISTLYRPRLKGQNETIASCELSPEHVRALVERLAGTSIPGDLEYFFEDDSPHVIASYPFHSFWESMNNLAWIAQYTKEYSLALGQALNSGLQIEHLKLPHFVRLQLPIFNDESALATVQALPNGPTSASFQCRADIIAHATHIEGMLHRIITDGGAAKASAATKLNFNGKIELCKDSRLVPTDLLHIVRTLKNLRNQAAHHFSFRTSNSDRTILVVNPVSEKMMMLIDKFVTSCEARYALGPARIRRFHRSVGCLADELNKKAGLTRHVTLGKQYPAALAAYFYG